MRPECESNSQAVCALDKNVIHVPVFRLCAAQGCLGKDAIYTVDVYQFI